MQDCVTGRNCDMVVTYRKHCAGDCEEREQAEKFMFELGGVVRPVG